MRLVRRLAGAALLTAVVAVSVACGGSDVQVLRTADLLLDGEPFRPEVALTPAERARGLMQRDRAPDDGMLFVFPAPTTDGFWMKDTLVPLRVVFFDRRGQRVDEAQMTPCAEDPCPVYSSERPFRYALELAAADPRSARTIGPPEELQNLAERAS